MSSEQPPRTTTAQAGVEDVPDARRLRTILIAVSLALMAVIASVSGLNVAQTHMAVEFGASGTTVLWIVNVYTLVLAALLLPLGALGDRLGRKPMLVTGLLLFGAAAVAAALAPSAGVMIAARVAAGASAAMIMPITLAVLTSTFPEEQRGRAIGVWTGVAGGGGILGMFLSALLVDVADWRWLFALPVALAAVALVMTWRSVPDSRARSAHSFDTAGAVLSGVAVTGLILVLQEGPERGWTDPVSLAGLGVGVAGAVGFVARELRRRDAALLDVRLFRHRGLAGGSLTLALVFGVQAGVAVVLFPYFQAVLGWSGLLSTVAMMPMAVVMMVTSGLAPLAAARVGIRFTMAAGVALTAAGLASMGLLVSVEGGYPSVLAGLLLMGAGMGLSMAPSTEAITGALPSGKQGVASALNDVTREFGTALGVALLGALVAGGYRDALDDRLGGVPRGTADNAREGIANAVEVAPGAGTHARQLLDAARLSFVDGWQEAMWVGTAVMGALFVLLVLRGPEDTPRPGAEDTTATGADGTTTAGADDTMAAGARDTTAAGARDTTVVGAEGAAAPGAGSAEETAAR
jgi:EmrB/QacA subfamily drug resistance transporter